MLSAEFKITHLDLDILAWLDAKPPQRKPLADSLEEINFFVQKNQEWVIEGCYADLLEHVIKNANEIVFLNKDIETCISNCKKRPWEQHKYKSQEEQNNNLEMLIDWVKEYPNRTDEFSLKAHKQLFDDFSGKKTEYISNHQTNDGLENYHE